jgi:hypothetical protein
LQIRDANLTRGQDWREDGRCCQNGAGEEEQNGGNNEEKGERKENTVVSSPSKATPLVRIGKPHFLALRPLYRL